jgi:aspartyl protease family protein
MQVFADKRPRKVMMTLMGQFTVTLDVGDIFGRDYDSVEALVDTGASNSVFPGSLLRRLGVEIIDRNFFRMADGRMVEFDMGTVRVRLDGRERFSVVVFGDEDMRPLLGAITLEEFHLGVDPLAKRLVRTEGMLATVLP